jgi:anaerobic dimethyl sulfoxide reductase subunit A
MDTDPSLHGCSDGYSHGYTIIKERLQEQNFIDRYTIGFEAFEDYLTGKQDGIVKTPLWAEKITGVSADTIERLAVEYAKTKPAALISGIAPGRTAMGEQYHRAAIALAVLTGNIGVHGGGAGGRSLGEQYPFNPYPFKLGQLMNVPPNPVDTIAEDNKLTLKNYTIWRSSAMVHRSNWQTQFSRANQVDILKITNCSTSLTAIQ